MQKCLFLPANVGDIYPTFAGKKTLNGKLRLSYVHFEERKGIVSSSRQAKIAILGFFA